MSARGFIRYRGKRCDVYRLDTTDAAGGLVTVTAVAIAREVKIYLDVIEEELAQKIFGRAVQLSLRGAAPLEPVLNPAQQHGISVLDGTYAGRSFRVTGRRINDERPMQAYQELALDATTEVWT